jgi:hypothetical protein
LPRQSMVMKANRRRSLVPGGRWAAVTLKPVSSLGRDQAGDLGACRVPSPWRCRADGCLDHFVRLSA